MNIGNVGQRGFAAPDFEALRKSRFGKTDQDSDGKITKQELAAVLPKNGHGPGVDEVFGKVDSNQDGVIDDNEDKAAFETMRKQGPHGPPDASKIAEKILKKADADSDGKISQVELGKLLSKDGEDSTSLEKLFKAMDSDNDGSVTQTELEDTLKKLMEQAQSHHNSTHGNGYGRNGTTTTQSTTESRFSVTA